MPALRRFVNQLAERENIDQVFLVADKQLRANRNGNLYLQLRLTDKTGSLTGMLWNANDNVFNSVADGQLSARRRHDAGLQRPAANDRHADRAD